MDKKKDETITIDQRKKKIKRVEQLDDQVKTKQREMSMVKMKSMFFVAVTMITAFGFIGST